MPFTTRDGAEFPVPVLAQIDKKIFEICVPFKYRHRADDEWIIVPKDESFRRTDLASVPGFLLWLVPRYGVHTLAALVHDQLVDDPPTGGRVEADTIFRDALGELKVPWIRRWIMWAAVSLGTIWDARLLGKLRVVVWGLAALVATMMFWQHTLASIIDLDPWSSWFIFGHGRWWDLAIVAALGLAFVPRIGLGLLAGATLIFIFVPTVAVLVIFGLYLALEWIARGLLLLYNWLLVDRLGAAPVENIPAVMTLSKTPVAPGMQRGCPELAVNAAPATTDPSS
jgi:hypothetical protein